MTPEIPGSQFDVLAKLLRAQEKPRTAARMVLVDGIPNIEAARATRLSQTSVSNALTRYREAHSLVQTGYPSLSDAMTTTQFDVLAKLLRSLEGPRKAARMILVEGNSNAEAARASGLSATSVTHALRRYRDAHWLIKSAYKADNT